MAFRFKYKPQNLICPKGYEKLLIAQLGGGFFAENVAQKRCLRHEAILMQVLNGV